MNFKRSGGLSKRSSGILMPLFSLPSPYGIGTLGQPAYDFVDFLKDAGQRYWQLPPVCPAGSVHSPYASPCTFAGNPLFIDFDLLADEGLLKKNEYTRSSWGANPEKVDYKRLSKKVDVLRKAFDRVTPAFWDANISPFHKENAWWLDDYALYMTLKMYCGDTAWYQWKPEYIHRKPNALRRISQRLEKDIRFWIFTQYQFFLQWGKLRKYANQKGIFLIGELPLYVSWDSAEAWANQQMFLLNSKQQPIDVAGCPPDALSEDGQLWGNPLYRWDVMKEDGYDWWKKRFASSAALYDVIRLGHFSGFDSYYAIPAKETTAKKGEWREGPGAAFLKAVSHSCGNPPVIAEDFDIHTKSVQDMLKQSGYPGMKVLQFAFGGNGDSEYLPHHYKNHCIVYTGTHNNDTVRGWFENAPQDEVKFCKKYLRISSTKNAVWDFIAAAWLSAANISIAQMQDFLELPSSARIADNWEWRAAPQHFTSQLSKKIFELTKMYGRCSVPEKKKANTRKKPFRRGKN